MAQKALMSLSAISSLVLLSALSASALTYNQEVAAAQLALARTPGYSLFAKNFKSLTSITAKYSRATGQQPVTVLAPNDAAVIRILSSINPTTAVITRIVKNHIIRGAVRPALLVSLRAGARLPTYDLGSFVVKASAAGKRPVLIKSSRTRAVAAIVKLIYSGQHIQVYGVNAVLNP